MSPSVSERSSGGQVNDDALGWIYDKVASEADARVCKDIPDAGCRQRPRKAWLVDLWEPETVLVALAGLALLAVILVLCLPQVE